VHNFKTMKTHETDIMITKSTLGTVSFSFPLRLLYPTLKTSSKCLNSRLDFCNTLWTQWWKGGNRNPLFHSVQSVLNYTTSVIMSNEFFMGYFDSWRWNHNAVPKYRASSIQ